MTPTAAQERGPTDLQSLEEKARRLLRRCRYEDAAAAFKEVSSVLQRKRLEKVEDATSSPHDGEDINSNPPSVVSDDDDDDADDAARREIGALEGLAVCCSRLLDDAGAEAAQRQALELRCRAWAADENTRSDSEADGKDTLNRDSHQPGLTKGRKQMSARDVAAAKRAAVPCLLNLASFVSNQGRHVDAEVVLRAVLKIIDETTSQSVSEDRAVPDLTAPASPASAARTVAAADDERDRQSSAAGSDRPGDVSPAIDASRAPPPPPLASPSKGGGIMGRLEEGSLASMRQFDGDDRYAEDVELDMIGRQEGVEDAQHTAAVTRHHLAVVIHAQGRAQEAQEILESSVAALKRTDTTQQAVCLAQAMHDLAGVVRPADPARACSLYREALDLLESSRGVNHFLTAPTLAKLGSLLGDGLVAAAAIPLAPAAPAGPGAAGIARAAGLAEAVCAPGVAAEFGDGAAVAAAAAWCKVDASEAEAMIKRAVLIQGRHLGLRHPAVATSMRSMAELYRKQGRLSEAEPLFRRAISIWESLPGSMHVDAVGALHGMAHCVLAGAGADWLGRFESAFALVDQAYGIASSQPSSDPDGNFSSSRLLLEALRMIRARQRRGRGDPQPASADIVEGVWNGRWDPRRQNGTGKGAHDGAVAGGADEGQAGSKGEAVLHVRACERGDDPRCAVCLEEVGDGFAGAAAAAPAPAIVAAGSDETALPSGVDPDGHDKKPSAISAGGADGAGCGAIGTRSEGGSTRATQREAVEIKADIGLVEASLAATHDALARGRLAYLPCGHRFHTHCIGRWLVHSASCPSCRSKVEDEVASPPPSPPPQQQSQQQQEQQQQQRSPTCPTTPRSVVLSSTASPGTTLEGTLEQTSPRTRGQATQTAAAESEARSYPDAYASRAAAGGAARGTGGGGDQGNRVAPIC